MEKDADLVNPESEFYNKPEQYALKVFDFYVCFQCQRPYYGGKHECAQGVEVFESEFLYFLSCFSCFSLG